MEFRGRSAARIPNIFVTRPCDERARDCGGDHGEESEYHRASRMWPGFLPAALPGTSSPYPTVVTVCTAHQRPVPTVGKLRWWTKVIRRPETTVMELDTVAMIAAAWRGRVAPLSFCSIHRSTRDSPAMHTPSSMGGCACPAAFAPRRTRTVEREREAETGAIFRTRNAAPSALAGRAARATAPALSNRRAPPYRTSRQSLDPGIAHRGARADSSSVTVGIPVYSGEFGPAQAERLLWRAGFGPRGGEAEISRRRG